ncbi:hypothetical protein C7534_110133 [Pseudomonas sp. OV226]|nr:hypothetical protein C7534_110133 [Pseudomonas sp. OV226]
MAQDSVKGCADDYFLVLQNGYASYFRVLAINSYVNITPNTECQIWRTVVIEAMQSSRLIDGIPVFVNYLIIGYQQDPAVDLQARSGFEKTHANVLWVFGKWKKSRTEDQIRTAIGVKSRDSGTPHKNCLL